MSESDFWDALRFRMNRLPAEDWARSGVRPGWCDWFEPKSYTLGGPSPRISGRVGFVSDWDAWQFRFVMLVGHPIRTPPEVEWVALLPPEDSVGWLSADQSGDILLIDLRWSANATPLPGTASDASAGSSDLGAQRWRAPLLNAAVGHKGPRDVKVALPQPRKDPHARRYRGPVRI